MLKVNLPEVVATPVSDVYTVFLEGHYWLETTNPKKQYSPEKSDAGLFTLEKIHALFPETDFALVVKVLVRLYQSNVVNSTGSITDTKLKAWTSQGWLVQTDPEKLFTPNYENGIQISEKEVDTIFPSEKYHCVRVNP